MYFDRDQSRDLSQSRVSEHDDRDARHWTRKLYEFESKDPDRYNMTKSSSKSLLNALFGKMSDYQISKMVKEVMWFPFQFHFIYLFPSVCQ